jgi:hypothetical protein
MIPEQNRTNLKIIVDNSPPEEPKHDYTFEFLVDAFIQNRDAIEKMEERHKLELKPAFRLRELLAEQLLLKLKATGQEMARTKAGTVSAAPRISISCSDPGIFMDYVRENDAYELLDRRPNKTACIEFNDVNGQLPPGVKMNTKQDVNVQRPRKES